MRNIRELKNKHKGERIFVFGTGPSLKKQNIERVKSKTTIGCNLLNRLFTPTYLCIGDRGKYNQPALKEEIDNVDCIKIFPGEDLIKEIPEDSYRINVKTDKYLFKDEIWDLEDLSYTTSGWSTMHAMNLPLALFMGAKEVVILGLDFTMKTHFYDSKGGASAPNYETQQAYSYHKINEIYEEKGVKLWNATPKTRLNTIEKRKLGDILKEEI